MNKIIENINRKVFTYKQSGKIKAKYYTYYIFDITYMTEEERNILLKNSKCDIDLDNEQLIFSLDKGQLKGNIYFISFYDKVLEQKPKKFIHFSFGY